MNNPTLKKELQSIINTCLDGVNGYTEAAKHVQDQHLASIFRQLAHQRQGFIETLQQTGKQAGFEVEPFGTYKGMFHRMWLATRSTFNLRGDYLVLDESITGEKAAIKKYDAVLNRALPTHIDTLLEEQVYYIRMALALLLQENQDLAYAQTQTT